PDAVARITGTDIDPEAVRRAQINAEHACVTAGRALQLIGSDARIQRPDFDVADFKDIRAPYDQGLLLANPPYGERLGDAEEAEKLYAEMHSLFQDFAGWEMGFITSNPNFESAIGKQADSAKTIKSGNLDTKFYIYK
nr:class I SAM-dependent RNA methyltransferase [Treponemataceae bacterium]